MGLVRWYPSKTIVEKTMINVKATVAGVSLTAARKPS